MSCSIDVSDSRIPETVVISIDRSAGFRETTELAERMEPILPELNWRTHFFIVREAGPGAMESLWPIAAALSRFVLENQFVTYYLHPVIPVGAPDGTGIAQWKELLDCMRPFQEQAYEQQSEARLLILPIIEPAADETDENWIRAAECFLTHLAKPSVFLRGPGALQKARRGAGREIRFYIERDLNSGTAGIIEQLWTNRVFEDLLERVKAAAAAPGVGGDSSLQSPCRSHLVIDQPTGKVFPCFYEWSCRHPLGTVQDPSALAAAIAGKRGSPPCAECFSQSLSSMTDNLIANGRLREGGRVHLELALAFSGRMQHARAIEHASKAGDFVSSDIDRAAALICKGLCHLATREFEAAESALKQATELSEDPGLVSYHRGRVQFEWRDYIEALERFDEALASGSTAVPEADLLFYMSVSHINIEEYREARPYLERWKEIGSRRAVLLYYSGLCDVGEERFESALCEFREAEKAGPAEEDLGRVLFYIGFCLKQLGRHEEAIPPLERAAVIDSEETGILNLLGFCFYKTARHAEAVRCFERVIELDPRSAIDYANLAVNLQELDRTQEAIVNYRRALSFDPSIGFARENLERLLEQFETPDTPNTEESS